MRNLFCLAEAQMARLAPFFPMSHGRPRVDDPLPGNRLPANRERGRVLGGMIFLNRNGLRWCDAAREYGPHKTLHTRWKRWGEKGVFARILVGLAADEPEKKTVMIDVEAMVRHWSENHCRGHLKMHRTATSRRVKKGSVDARSGGPGAA